MTLSSTCGRLSAAALVASTVVLGAALPAAASSDRVLDDQAELFVNDKSTTVEAARRLKGQARADAQYLAQFPTAHWLTSGSPKEVERDARKVVKAADKAEQVPVLVAYNLPFRDCAQYSAGGATSTEEYTAWIDGLVRGIGDREAVVILEPDGLGIIPWYTTVNGNLEWCQPQEADADTAAAQRFEQLDYAVDELGELPRTAVYLDGTHSAWLGVGDIADRLLKAGVQDADGFFLNASNYQHTANLEQYGTWISSCLAYVTEVNAGDFGGCGNQYWSGGPANGWTGVALSPYGEWSDTAADPTLNTAGVNSRYDLVLGDVEPTTHFVIDTSRNGQGPWDAPEGVYPSPEDWCNPPLRGLGHVATTRTGSELVDAYLWIKVPGESDGQCYRGTEGPLDPARGVQDPPAGEWFPAQARELIELADLDG